MTMASQTETQARIVVLPRDENSRLPITRVTAALFLGALAILVMICAAPMTGALQIGGDEHYEVMKAYLWSTGVPLYGPLWSDQPPLFTYLLGSAFKCFGARIGVARSVTAIFGLFLLFAYSLFTRDRRDRTVDGIAAFGLLSAPGMLELGISAMQEIPAIATAVWALWPIRRWQATGRHSWLFISGVLLACALQLKLTAIIVAPALLSQILLLPERNSLTVRWRAGLTFGTAVLASYFAIAFMSNGFSPERLFRFHFSSKVAAITTGTSSVPFLSALMDHPEVIGWASIGLVVLSIQQTWHICGFAWVWLLTAAAVHTFHRPWWSYYYLHFAVPLCWLAAYGILTVISRPVAATGRLSIVIVSVLAVGTFMFIGTRRLVYTVNSLHNLPAVRDDPMVQEIARNRTRTRWIYTTSPMHAFHAGVATIPELTVLSLKRFWSGQINEAEIWQTVARYAPEQLLLDPRTLNDAERAFIADNYVESYRYGAHTLYIAKRLAQPGQ